MKSKLSVIGGALNIALAAVMFVNVIMMGLCVLLSFVMSFTIFFLAAIPLLVIFGALFSFTIAAAVTSLIAGIGSVVGSAKGGKVSKLFAVATIVMDAIYIPASFAFFIVMTISAWSEATWLSILLVLVEVCALLLAVASLVVTSANYAQSSRAELAGMERK